VPRRPGLLPRAPSSACGRGKKADAPRAADCPLSPTSAGAQHTKKARCPKNLLRSATPLFSAAQPFPAHRNVRSRASQGPGCRADRRAAAGALPFPPSLRAWEVCLPPTADRPRSRSGHLLTRRTWCVRSAQRDAHRQAAGPAAQTGAEFKVRAPREHVGSGTLAVEHAQPRAPALDLAYPRSAASRRKSSPTATPSSASSSTP
jgi:hypothetical protein